MGCRQHCLLRRGELYLPSGFSQRNSRYQPLANLCLVETMSNPLKIESAVLVKAGMDDEIIPLAGCLASGYSQVLENCNLLYRVVRNQQNVR